MLTRWLVLAALLVALGAQADANGAGRAEHVVVLVWDGMRPDLVSETNTPSLWKMAQQGVTFRNHHAVYPSLTNVNGTAIATGVYPQRSGLLGNHEYRPAVDLIHSFDTEDPAVLRKVDELTKGKYLGVPTIEELIQQSGRTTVVVGAKDVVLLHDRSAIKSPARARNSVNLYRKSADAIAGADALGPFPGPATPNEKQDQWATQGLTGLLWRRGIPAFSLLWLSDPDLSQHAHAPGSPIGLQAIRNADHELAVVLQSLDKAGVREATDVFVVSDHGFSTVNASIDLRVLLTEAGFHAGTAFAPNAAAGNLIIVPNGGAEFFYVKDHDATVTQKLVSWLQQSDFAGVIFSREGLAGTFRLDAAAMATQDAPDVMMTFHWSDAKNEFGTPGLIAADWNRRVGAGTHATLSPFDMHNTLVAAGPDFRKGTVDELPTGNVDLAPTILQILGIKAPPMDGRILAEAMIDHSPNEKPQTQELEASREFPHAIWRQRLKISRIGHTNYFDEGSAAIIRK